MPLGAFRLNTIGKASTGGDYFLMYNTGANTSNIVPGGFEVDSVGNIYILDMNSSKLAAIDPTANILWQKNITSPIGVTTKQEGGLLSLDYSQTYLLCALKESTTSISACYFKASNGTLLSKAVSSVAAGNTIQIGNVKMGTGASGTSQQALVVVGATVSGVNKLVMRHHIFSGTTISTTPTSYYHLASGATSVADCKIGRYVPPNNGAITGTLYLAYENYIAQYTGTTSFIHQSTRSFTGGLHSIAADSGNNGYIMKNNIIQKFSSAWTKAWEKTHTVGGVGGSHYIQQSVVVDSSSNVYSCYFRSATNKIYLYKLNSSGVLQWTKSIYMPSIVEVESMVLKIVGTGDLYFAFKYGANTAGGIGILKIPTDGSLTKTFDNGFVLGDETGSVADSTNFTLTANTPSTTSVSIGSSGLAFIQGTPSTPTFTKGAI